MQTGVVLTKQRIAVELDDTADRMTQGLRRNGTPVSTTATDAALFFDNGDIQSRFAEPHRGTFSAWSAADYDDVKVVVLCHKDFLVIFA